MDLLHGTKHFVVLYQYTTDYIYNTQRSTSIRWGFIYVFKTSRSYLTENHKWLLME